MADRIPGEAAAGLRPTRAEIDLAAFRHNLGVARRLAGGARVMAVLKADGYGHGAERLAREAVSAGCAMIGVATVPEALALRAAGLRADILVLGGVPPGAEEAALSHGLAAVVHDLPSAVRLDAAARYAGQKVRVHLKFDTGMGRLGFLPPEAGEACRRVAAMEGLLVEGLMTHYARAEEEDPAPTLRQAELFAGADGAADEAGLLPRWVHAMNSAALLLGRGPVHELVRPGIMLYGSVPAGIGGDEESHGLMAVMTLRTYVMQVRDVPAGWPVSYGAKWTAPRPSRLAVLGAGYADGFLRYNSGGEVLVRGRRAPVVGAVCMDMCVADVTGIPGAAAGDEAVLFGRQGREAIPASEVARRGGTISYEVFCGVSPRVPRLYKP